MSQPLIVECPTCGAPVEWNEKSPNRPFCSDRCKLIDLGAWASEDHAIPGSPLEDDVFSADLDAPPRGH
ncbi:DNA gyrase inhibitor YacG [Pseudomonas schmalbachii]|uniref:DNA gyrase inhibitor YacG n=1 Tax=Pseudomonas schmalbachii TaxID=2816993 RepID=A0ABS3TSU3_9PSED|nr:DNA gyrase inhibitor YacG [Pseudomonas schmalbachii]MBO3276740.1 DNA gyrase inhibitor YacG [Pseudomonas schmalbachii]